MDCFFEMGGFLVENCVVFYLGCSVDFNGICSHGGIHLSTMHSIREIEVPLGSSPVF